MMVSNGKAAAGPMLLMHAALCIVGTVTVTAEEGTYGKGWFGSLLHVYGS